MSRTRTLLEDVEDFLLLHPDIRPATLGREAAGDRDLVFDLRRGRSPREVTVIRVREWMAAYEARRAKLTPRMEAARKRLRASLPPASGAASEGSPAATSPSAGG